jgi:hypothetical protein
LQGAELNFSHIEPTAMLGRIVTLTAIQQRFGFSRFKSFLKRRRMMGLQVVHHNRHALSLRTMHG